MKMFSLLSVFPPFSKLGYVTRRGEGKKEERNEFDDVAQSITASRCAVRCKVLKKIRKRKKKE